MDALITNIFASLKATEIIPMGRRVKYVAPGGCALAGVAEAEIGTSIYLAGKDNVPIGTMVGVQLRTLPVMCEAAGAFADGATVKRMASGKVDDTGAGADFGIALQASGASGDLVMVLPLDEIVPVAPTVYALTSTNGTFAAAADLAAVKVEGEKVGDDVRAIHAALVTAGIIVAA